MGPPSSRMNGAMVPVSPAEHVKMTLKSGKLPEEPPGVHGVSAATRV